MKNFLDSLRLDGRRKLPVIYQTEASECGLACLAMIACYHGYEIDMFSLRRKFSISLQGITLANLIDIASRMEFTSRPIRLEIEFLYQLSTPAILHWDLNHFVVLSEVIGDRLVIHDPACGKVEMSIAEVSKHFTGVAVEVDPGIEFKRKVELQPLGMRNLLGKVRGLKTSLTQILILALTLEVFSLVGPMLHQWIIDDALVSSDADLLTIVVVGLSGLALLQALVTYFRSHILIYLGASLNVQWVANVVTHLLRLPVSYFEKRNVGDIQTRFGAIQSIQQILTMSFVTAVLDGAVGLTTLGMMLVYSPTLTAISGVVVLAYAGIRQLRFHALRAAAMGQLVRYGAQQSMFLESLRGIQAIKLFNMQSNRMNRYMKLVVETANCDVQIKNVARNFEALNGILVAVETGLVLWLGGRFVLAGQFSIGMLMAFLAYKMQFTGRITSLVDRIIELRMLRMQGERLADIVLTEPEEDQAQPYLSTEQIQPTLELRNIYFRYSDGGPWILKDFSLKIESGESVVLVGASGAGKTTVLKILLGQLVPQLGEVLVGGIPMHHIGLAQYREMLGAVMQNDQLFAGSLMENISFFEEKINLAKIEEAAAFAQIHEDICRMPMGYNSLVGDMGSTLSGGQKQRIFLARALYKNPKFLFLDEATSHVDTEMESSIGLAIGKLSMTRIVVAHRLETIRTSGRLIFVGPIPQLREISQISQ
jgi:ATP-binding cassette subfamily B protein RaxB